MTQTDQWTAEDQALAMASRESKRKRMLELAPSQPLEKLVIPRTSGADHVYIVNGVRFDLQPGTVEIPSQIAQMVRDRVRTDQNLSCHGQPKDCEDMPLGAKHGIGVRPR